MKISIAALIISIIAAGGTFYGAVIANKAAGFNLKAKSYEVLVEALDKLGRPDEANKVREEQIRYHEGLLASQFIESSSIPIIYSNPEGVPEHQQEKLGNAIKAIENSPVSTDTNTISLGATYLGVKDYGKALESFDIVLSTDPDDTDARIFKAATLVLIAATPLECNIDEKSQTTFAVEAEKLITFDDVELSNKQNIFTTKIKTDIEKLTQIAELRH